MPTGYTHDVQTGKVTDFKDYAMACARAFGATITMRDDPADAPIPDEFPRSTYHDERLEAVEKELRNVLDMNEADSTLAANREYDELCGTRDEQLKRAAEERGRYEAMLAKVREWKSPSDDHAEMKKFMESQLAESIKFDCGTEYWEKMAVRRTGAEWRQDRLKNLTRDLAYHQEHRDEEIERTKHRNEWIRLLRESLETAAAT